MEVSDDRLQNTAWLRLFEDRVAVVKKGRNKESRTLLRASALFCNRLTYLSHWSSSVGATLDFQDRLGLPPTLPT